MKKIILLFTLLFLSMTPIHSQQTALFGDLNNGRYRNPVIPSDISDPDVLKVGDDYYGISSSFCFSPGILLMHSKDLVNWEIVGHIVDDISFLNPELGWNQMKGYFIGIWAGSLRYHNGTFYCHFTTPRGGWFVATTKDIRGKWNVSFMKDSTGRELKGSGWDDVCPLWDDDGQAYIIGSNFGHYWFPHLFKMSTDGTTLLDGKIDPKCDLKKNMEIIGGYVTKPYPTAEANKLYKWNGYYYFFFSEVEKIHNNEVRVPVMLRSKSIYGPYEERVIMHSQGMKVDKEPNQGALIETSKGQWSFVTHHGTGDFDGRVLSVVPAVWKDGWPFIGKDIDGDGFGEMVWEAEKPIKGFPKKTIQTSDDFNNTTLAPQWEWNHQPREGYWSLSERKGFLRLKAFQQLRKGEFFSTGNVLTQRYIHFGESEIIVKADISQLSNGQTMGLAHFDGGMNYSYIGIILKNNKKDIIWQRKQTSDKETQEIIGSDQKRIGRYIWFKTVVDFNGKASFFWSNNGKTYYLFGNTFQLSWGNFRGDRLGLFTFNNDADKGYVDIDSFTYLHKQKTVQEKKNN